MDYTPVIPSGARSAAPVVIPSGARSAAPVVIPSGARSAKSRNLLLALTLLLLPAMAQAQSSSDRDAERARQRAERDAQRERDREERARAGSLDTVVTFDARGTVSVSCPGGAVVVTAGDRNEIRVRARTESGGIRFTSSGSRASLEPMLGRGCPSS